MTYHFKFMTIKKRSRTQSVPFVDKKIEMMNAPILVQQFTPLVHSNSSFRLSYLLQQFCEHDRKSTQAESRQNTRGKTTSKQTDIRQNHFSLFRKEMVHCDRPRSNCSFCSVPQAVVSCCCRFFVGLVNASRTAACCEVGVVYFSSSTPTSD